MIGMLSLFRHDFSRAEKGRKNPSETATGGPAASFEKRSNHFSAGSRLVHFSQQFFRLASW
jgi:hypothetical protein